MDPAASCSARCSRCGTHLTQPIDLDFRTCNTCKCLHRIENYPCSCPLSNSRDTTAVPRCLAHCSQCGHHLAGPINASFSACTRCRWPHRLRDYPCTCSKSIPEDPDDRLFPQDSLRTVREEIATSDFSKQRKRILLLVTLVPEGAYTTVTAIKDCMNENFQLTGNSQILSAVRANIWDEVKTYRIVDFTENSCLGGGGQRNVLEEENGSVLLAQEGVRFDKNGRALGAAFRFF